MSDNLRALSGAEFEAVLLSARQRVRDLRRRLLKAERSGSTTRGIRPALISAEAELLPIEAEFSRRYAPSEHSE